MREVSELVRGLGAEMSGVRLFCLFLYKSRQHYMELVGDRLKNKQEMALHATGSRSVNLLTKGCCGYEKLAWIQGEFAEEKSSESY